jgi:hypothetical protein
MLSIVLYRLLNRHLCLEDRSIDSGLCVPLYTEPALKLCFLGPPLVGPTSEGLVGCVLLTLLAVKNATTSIHFYLLSASLKIR